MVLIRQSSLIIVSITTFIDALGSGILTFSLGLLLLKLTGLAIIFGFSIIIGPLISLAIAPLVGHLLDTLPHKQVALLGNFGMLISVLLFWGYSLIAFSPHSIFWTVIIFNILTTAASRFSGLAYISSVQNLVSKNQCQRLNAIMGLSSSISGIISAPIAGWLFSEVSFKFIILLRLLTVISTLTLTLMIDFTRYDSQPHQIMTRTGSFKAAYQYLQQQPRLLKVTVSVCLLNFTSVLFEIGTPFVILQRLHLTSRVSGLIQGCSSVGIVLGGIVISIVTIKRPFSFTIRLYQVYALLSLSVGFLLNSHLLPILAVLATFNLLAGSISAMADAPIFTTIQKNVPPEIVGHLMTLLFTLVQVLQPAGVFLYSGLLDYYQYPLIFLINGLVLMSIVFRFFGVHRNYT